MNSLLRSKNFGLSFLPALFISGMLLLHTGICPALACESAGTSPADLSAVQAYPMPMAVIVIIDSVSQYNGSEISCKNALDGTIDLTVSGGISPYTFSWSNGATTEDLAGLGAGTYQVLVTDSAGDTASASIIMAEPDLLEVASDTVTDASCFGVSDGSVIIAVTGGTLPYQYLWSNGDTTNNPISLPAGVYIVTITDANGCTTGDTVTVSEPAQVSYTFTLSDYSGYNTSCFGSNDGKINLFSAGSPGISSYLWANGDTTQTIDSLLAGVYSFILTDSSGCTRSDSITLIAPPEITYSAILSNYNGVNISCHGMNDGAVDLAPGNPAALASYLWSDGTTAEDLDSLVAGDYTITLTDTLGCAVSTVYSIIQPDSLFLNFQIAASVCDQPDGSILLLPAGGVAPFTYLWTDGDTSNLHDSLLAGTFSMTVTDANNCFFSDSATVSGAGVPSISLDSIDDVLCKGGNTGAIYISLSSGTSPYVFSWSDGSTTEDLINIIQGTYTVVVNDQLGCADTAGFTVNEPDSLLLDFSISYPTCASNNGSVTSLVTGGVLPYQYSWSNGDSASVTDSLGPGSYMLTVTDANGCQVTDSVTLGEIVFNAALSTYNGYQVSCYQANDGSIDITLISPLQVASFLWSDGSSLEDIDSLIAGTYTITITDTLGCQASASYDITSPDSLYLTFQLTPSLCDVNNGSVEATPVGGVPGYTYLWADGDTLALHDSLLPGSYTITVTDLNGCSVTGSDSLTGTTRPVIAIDSIQPVLCHGDTAGSVFISVTGGSGIYSYQWSSASTLEDLQQVLAGTYTLMVTDSNGCFDSATVFIFQPDSLVLAFQVNQPVCGVDNGTASGLISGGTAPYSYNWSNGDTLQAVSNLAGGTYSLVVKDLNGCLVTDSVTLVNNGLPVITLNNIVNISCSGSGDGSIDINVTNGTPPYTYSWSNGFFNEDIGSLASGTYTITVTDATSCESTTSFNVTEPALLTLSLNVSDETCTGANGIINSSVSGGTGGISYLWNTADTTSMISGLSAGPYSLTVTDSNGCTAGASASVTDHPGPQVTLDAVVDPLCFGGNDGSVQVTVTGNSSPFTFQWTGGYTTEDISGLVAGSYTLTATDTNSCTALITAVVSEPADITILLQGVNSTCSLPNGIVAATASGGTGAMTYLWSDGSTTTALINVGAGTYTVTVTDANNCTRSAQFQVADLAGPVLSVNSVSNVTCFGDNDGAIDILVTGGTAAFSYFWSSGDTIQDISTLLAGSYTVFVTDANNCTTSLTALVTEPQAISISLATNNATCGLANGSATAVPSGGTGGFVFLWSDASTGSTISNVPAGSYTVTVTDAGLCSSTAIASVNNIGGPAAVVTAITNVTCNGDSTGSIDMTVSGGTAPYLFNWSDGSTNEDLNGIPDGIYILTVTDSNSCIANKNVVVAEPPAIILNTNGTDATCSVSNGTATALATGGTGTLNYLWSQGSTVSFVNGLAPGTYTVTVSDASFCTKTSSLSIANLAGPSVAIQSVTPVTCNGGNDGSLVINATGGTAPLNYVWNNGSTLDNISGLPAMTYTVTVSDANNCTSTASAQVTEPAAISVSLTAANATCGLLNGSVTALAGGGTGSPGYLWSNGSTVSSITGLGSGSYTVTITDANNCSSSASASVAALQGPLTSLSGITNVLCNGDSSGAIDIAVNGGTNPVSYLWSNGTTAQDAVNLAAGSYTVTATDANLCTSTISAQVTQPALIQLNISAGNSNCNLLNGLASVTVTGGAGGYSFQWSNGLTSTSINNLSSGDYTITVTDLNACSRSAVITVGNTPGLSAAATTSGSVTCFGGNDGFIDITVNGGSPPFQYLWSNAETTEDIFNLTTGVYTVTVTDQDNCSAVSGEFVPQSAQITSSFNILNSLSGNPTGAITATPGGGNGNYTFQWSTGATGSSISGLLAGTYTLTISDSTGCNRTFFPVVSNLTSACGVTVSGVTDVSCNGGSNGSIDITVTGGVPPFTYLWSNLATTEDISGLQAGSYTVTVIDSLLCIANGNATVNEPAVLAVGISSANGTCGNANGTATANPAGGNGGYTYEWSDNSTNSSITGLAAGTYTVTVEDIKGCTATATVIITNSGTPSISSGVVTDVTCNSGNDADIDITVTGGVAPYTYAWTGARTTQDISSLVAGTYTVIVTDSNGCQTTANYSVTQPNAISISLTPTQTTCGNSNGMISSGVSGGTGTYGYAWSNGASTASVAGLSAGTYTLTITDGNGCTKTSSTPVSNVAGPSVSLASGINVSCNGGNNGALNITPANGTLPYTYSWSNGASIEDIGGLIASTYTVTISDFNACTVTLSATVTQPANISLSLTPADATCGNANGSITASASGGTGSITYNWSNGATVAAISGLLPNTYTITVTDGNLCTRVSSASIVNIAGPSASIVSVTQVSCNGGSNGLINSNPTGGTLPYSFVWSNAITTEDLSGLTAGTYTVTVTDDNSCTATVSTVVTQPVAISLNISKTNATCGNNNGQLAASPSGGTGAFTYSWSNAKTTATITGLAPATYTITVTDANNCTKTAVSTVTNIAGPSVSLGSASNISCNGGLNGSINITTSAGTAPYTYAWSNGNTTEDQSAIGAGSYSVTVTDANNCTSTLSVTLTQPSLLTVGVATSNPVCNLANGSLTASPSGGTAPFSYNWSNGATTANVSGINANTYTVTVSDSSGCTATTSRTLVNAGNPAVSFNSLSNISCNGGSNGSVNISVSSGTAPYTYSWSNSASTQDINGVAAGNYTVVITDSNNCSTSFDTVLVQPTAINLSISKTNAACGSFNGSASALAGGGAGGFSYQWSNGSSSATISNLSPGTYTVTVTDANACSKTSSSTLVNIVGPDVSLTSSSDVSCNGGNDGSIDITVTSGTLPYTYSWSNGLTTEDISGVPAGSYFILVTDSNECTDTLTIVLSQPPAITVGMSSVNSSCGLADGSATASPSGGTGGFTFLWSSGDTLATATGLAAGVYTVTVTDSNGCTKSASVNVSNTGGPLISISSITPPFCHGDSTGAIDISITGGTAPFTYSWSDNSAAQDLSGVPAGTYTVTVTDSLGCIAIFDTVVTEPAVLSVTFSNNNASCGGSNGVSTAIPAGGTGTYTYSWSNFKTTATNTGLAAGTYTVTVTDVNLCTVTGSVTITNTTNPGIVPSISHVSCFGGSNGSINITVLNGTPPFTYLWSNGATTEDISGLTAGPYTVTVTDSVGCVAIFSTPIVQPGQITPNVSSTGATCGQSNGSATVSASGGTGTLTYLWSNSVTTATNSNIPGGTYTVTVTDANNCTNTATVAVANTPNPVPSLSSFQDVLCNGDSTGSVLITVSSGTPPYTYLWSEGSTTQQISGVPSNTYTVTVTDQNGCTGTFTHFIAESPLLVISDSIIPAVCGNSNGGIAIQVSGGIMPYTYTWSTGATTDTIAGYPSGNYTVTVTDSAACSQTKVITITNVGGPLITLDSLFNVSCFGGNNGAVYISASLGLPPYSFQWSNGSTVASATGLIAGSYTVTVTDSAGCISTWSDTITEPGAIGIFITALNPSCGDSTGVIQTDSVTGGTAPFQYLWSTGDTTASIANLPAGTYTLSVTDGAGCVEDTVITLTDPGVPQIALDSSINILCHGDSSGSIYITVSGGYPDYVYNWSDGSSVEDLLNLPANNYTLIVTDSLGCSDTASYILSEPAQLTLLLTDTAATCGNNNGTVTSTAGGGVPSYTYQWSNTATTSGIMGLGPGIYTLTVTDANGCKITGSDTVIAAPGPVISGLNATNVTCFGQTNGSISITVTGGSIPLTYSWSNGGTTQNLTGIPANTYTVTVTDTHGCTDTASGTVIQPPLLTVSVNTTSSNCGSANGTAVAVVSGGNGGYQYSWSNGQSLDSISGLAGGTFTVTVTDSLGCTQTASGTVVSNNAPVVSITSVADVTCFGLTNGSIDVTVTGGSVPFTYSWSNTATTEDISSLGPGSYTITVTDANGCTGTISAQVNQPAAIAVTLQTTLSACLVSNGTIKVLTTGGTPPYTYLWFSGAVSDSIGGLGAGNYTVTITDNNGCTKDTVVTVSNPAAPVLSLNSSKDVNCFGGNDGFIDINVTGGNGPYTYVWNSGETTEDIQNLTANTYTVTVTDQFGCSAVYSLVVSEPPDIVISITTVSATCGSANGSACAAISGGISPYVFIWSNGFTTNCIQNLTAGNYPITVTDNNGCIKVDAANISNITGPDITVTDSSNVKCHNGSNGAINITVSGGSVPYSFIWSNGATTEDISSLPAGTYTVTVTDLLGCLALKSIVITQPPLLSYNAIIPDKNDTFNISCTGYSDGSIDLFISGGTPPYTYLWSDFSTTQDLSNITAGTYTVIISDNNSCSMTAGFILSEPPPLSGNAGIDFTICGLDSAQVHADIPATGLTGFWSIIAGSGILADSTSPTTPVNSLSNGNVVLTWIISDGICYDTSAITISVATDVNAIAGIDLSICGDSASLTATPISFGYGFWSGVEGAGMIHDSLDPTTLVTSLAPGKSTFKWTVVNGNCSDSDYVSILVRNPEECLSDVEMPSGFSPNGDGKNEYFLIHGLEDYPSNNITIYNRWGNLVYEMDGYDNRWDGTSMDGKTLPAGTYFVVLKINNYPILKKGFVDLRR